MTIKRRARRLAAFCAAAMLMLCGVSQADAHHHHKIHHRHGHFHHHHIGHFKHYPRWGARAHYVPVVYYDQFGRPYVVWQPVWRRLAY